MNSKSSIKKSERNYPVRNSIRLLKEKKAKVSLKENLSRV